MTYIFEICICSCVCVCDCVCICVCICVCFCICVCIFIIPHSSTSTPLRPLPSVSDHRNSEAAGPPPPSAPMHTTQQLVTMNVCCYKSTPYYVFSSCICDCICICIKSRLPALLKCMSAIFRLFSHILGFNASILLMA